MEKFIVGNGFVLDGVIYELTDKLEFGFLAKYFINDDYKYLYITNDEMKKAEPIPF